MTFSVDCNACAHGLALRLAHTPNDDAYINRDAQRQKNDARHEWKQARCPGTWNTDP